jgi:hypothetical protein
MTNSELINVDLVISVKTFDEELSHSFNYIPAHYKKTGWFWKRKTVLIHGKYLNLYNEDYRETYSTIEEAIESSGKNYFKIKANNDHYVAYVKPHVIIYCNSGKYVSEKYIYFDDFESVKKWESEFKEKYKEKFEKI